MRRYPEYKYSPLGWVGEIPKHWEMKRAKFIFRRLQRPIRENDEIITAFRDGIVTLRKNRRTLGFTNSLKEIGYQGIRKDDLIIHAMDGHAGAIGVSDSDGKSSPVYSVCRPISQENVYYYAYLLRYIALSGFIESLARGIRERSTEFRFNEFKELDLLIPTVSEQAQIANFLDRKTEQIDELIRIKERRIELLQEQRTALINQAVTKGLDPNVEMKPSGVEWIGDIPGHWEVIKFHYLSQESKRKNDDDIDREMLSLSSYTGINVKQYEYENIKRSKEESLTYLVVEPNQLVVNPMWQIQRGIGVSYLHGIVSPGYRVYYIDLERLIPQYLHYLMRSDIYVDEYNKHIRGLTTYDRSVKKEDFEAIPVLLPTKQEQTQITNFLDHKTEQIDELIATEQRKIELLKEYRQSLISEAVTGKIDVRNEV